MTTGSEYQALNDPRPALPAFAPVEWRPDMDTPPASDAPIGRRKERAGVLLAVVVLVGWTAFFLWSQRGSFPLAPREAPQLVALWAAPLLLVGVAWLLLGRGRLRGADDVGRAMRELDEHAGRLETRLAAANRELSLAREFMAAQARELDSLGRVATERLTDSGARLQQLVDTCGERMDVIAGTSRAAFDNMVQVREQLPVLTNAARDLGNTIGSAGQTAQGHVADLDRALGRIAEAEAANLTQLDTLQRSAAGAVSEFTQRAEQLSDLAVGRFDALARHSETLGVDAERIAATLRDAEAAALDRWRENAARVEADIGASLVVLDNAERDAFAASHRRLLALSDNAERVDALIDERARTFAEAIDARRRIAGEAEEQAVALFAQRMQGLDAELAARQAAHVQQGDVVAGHAEAIVSRLEQSEARVSEIVGQSRRARDELAVHVRELVASLADGREALAGTDGDVRALITSSERVRDLLDAAATRSRGDLPGVLAKSEAHVRAVHELIARLREVIDEAGERSGAVALQLVAEADNARARLSEIGERQSQASADAVAHLGHLEAIEERLDAIVETGGTLSSQAGSDLAETLGALVRDMTEAGTGAFDRALRGAAAQAAGRIEQAAAHAAGVGGEAAGQLRQEIARVEQHTAALEARVAAARARAEAPLDRDFARRAALITETLNSNAIDIAAAIGQDHPDTAWAAYLRGDRGVFTRRAVRLLDGGQSRAIISLYEGDTAFRDHASRYIHDFEAILRELLAARDGHVLAVTMLSSDLGKLYVALAQAIERLRS